MHAAKLILGSFVFFSPSLFRKKYIQYTIRKDEKKKVDSEIPEDNTGISENDIIVKISSLRV